MIQLEINERITISNRDIVKSIESMETEQRVDILERLISMESVEKQKWNLIISCRLLSKNDLSKENVSIILSELDKLKTTLKQKLNDR